jgi:DNA helicase II / ATP-dependent DNA helicase PcrA
MMAYLRVIHSPEDSMALERIVNVPNRRLGKQRIDMLIRDAQAKKGSLWASLNALASGKLQFPQNDAVAVASIRALIQVIEGLGNEHRSGQKKTVADLVHFVRNDLGYDTHLRKKFGPEVEERYGNLEELKVISKEIDNVVEQNVLPDIGIQVNQDGETPLEKFLGNVVLMTDVRDKTGGIANDCVIP